MDTYTVLPTKSILMYSDNVTLNFSLNHTGVEQDEWAVYYITVILWQYVAPIAFFLITIVGTVGNGLVAYVIISNKKMQTSTNLLLLNLAFADISLLLICVPFTAIKYAAEDWPFGNIFCKITKYFAYVSVYITIWTLVCISILRFMTVVYSQGTAKFRTKRNITIINVSIWIIMTLVNIPVLLISKTRMYGDYTFCGSNPTLTTPLFLTFFAFAYALPLTLIIILYLMIVVYLRRQTAGSALDKSHGRERTARACKMIVLVVVVFMLSWLPSHTQQMIALYHPLPSGPVYHTFRILWECMSFANSCANPIIYNFGSQDFRKCFKQIICCKKITYWKMRKASRRATMANNTKATAVDNAYFV